MVASNSPERITFLDCPVDRITIPQILDWIQTAVKDGRPRQIAVVNANKFYLMARNPKLGEIIRGADLIIPEWAVVWGAQKLKLPLLEHSGGLLVSKALIPYAAENGLRLYLLGARYEVVSQLVNKMKEDYPAITIVGFHDGYLRTPEIEETVRKDIRQEQPDILLVAMGSPKQEYWIHMNQEDLAVPVSLGIGGSFDVLSGFKTDTPDWARGKGLEWIYRLLQNPRAYWRRYLITTGWFVWQVWRARWRGVRNRASH